MKIYSTHEMEKALAAGWSVYAGEPGAKVLTREQVSEAISLCFQYGNEAICNHLFGVAGEEGRRS